MSEQKIVSGLQKLLMECDIEPLLNFLHRLHIRYTIVGNEGGMFKMRIFKEGMLAYEGASNKSVRSAICDAIAKFLINEQGDYHAFMDFRIREVKRHGQQENQAPVLAEGAPQS